jgi:phage recombination protein Bet
MAGSGNGSQAMATTNEERVTSFVPFGGRDPIKLSVHIVQHMVCLPTKSGARCSAEQAMKFIMLCKARALNPFEGDAFLVGYDGKDGPTFSLITAHQAFLKRAEVHNEYDGMESGPIVRDATGALVDREGDFILDDDTILGAWATVHFKTRKYPMKKRVRLGPFNTGYSRWKIDPVGMIVKVAEADALRSSFPTMLGGMYLDGELSGGMLLGNVVNAPTVSPGKALADPAEVPNDPPVNEDADDPAAEAAPTTAQQILADDLGSCVDQARSVKDLEKVGGKLAAKREDLGAMYAGVLERFQARMRELSAK